MKKFILIHTLLGIVLFLGGCGQTENTNEQSEILNPNNRGEAVNEERRAEVGYVRYTKEELAVQDNNNEIHFNREQLADIITRTILQSGNFDEAASLVTDKEVVIAYEKRDDIDKSQAAEVTGMTARSFLPSFYKIYVTDEPNHMDVIHSLHREQTNNQDDLQVIERVIEEIKAGHNEQDWR